MAGISSISRVIDGGTEFGRRVERRLREDTIGWLTTIDGRGTPQPVPVWFLWEDGSVLVYSEPEQAKLRNIERHARVSLHLGSNAAGDDIVVLLGDAHVSAGDPPADDMPAYLEKYRDGIARIGMTPEVFARTYSVPIRISVSRVRGH
jgi:PPOX class probable F420-dependent enzyme